MPDGSTIDYFRNGSWAVADDVFPADVQKRLLRVKVMQYGYGQKTTFGGFKTLYQVENNSSVDVFSDVIYSQEISGRDPAMRLSV